MSKYTEILQKYWGYSSFRSLQEEIITSVAEGKDTLGLMPTGGGKSITFQVFSLSEPGICIVVTPLISLMKDQVENLQRKGIKALAIHSGMTSRQVAEAFKSAAWGDYKFLYLSPERLSSMYFRERLLQLHVNLITVDEAHCISQWGYDFRPSYLSIIQLRELLPYVPVLALTATATPAVVNDIQQQLGFQQSNVLQKSFERNNLSYIVRNTDDKLNYLLDSIRKMSGSGVVYTQSRAKTKEIAEQLMASGISADYYHAGLSAPIRSRKQEEWMSGRTQVIVATNAFGMGIDKSDVRFVMHIAPPTSLEAYFQEAGRAGRDGKRAYALLIASNRDQGVLKRKVAEEFPSVDFVKQIYHLLGSYFQVPIGTGEGSRHSFDLFEFCKIFKFSSQMVQASLKILQRQGLIEFALSSMNPATVLFIVNRDSLYSFNTPNKQLEEFLRELMRYGGGMFTVPVAIDEERLAEKCELSVKQVKQFLIYLSSMKILRYIPQRQTPFITYTLQRLAEWQVTISKKNYHDRKEDYERRIAACINYSFSNDTCRSVMLLEYFGEKNAKPCGQCDVCRERKGIKAPTPKASPQLPEQILALLKQGEQDFFQLQQSLQIDDKLLSKNLRQLMSDELITMNAEQKFKKN